MKIRHELKEGKIIHVREGDGIAQRQKINSPTFAYMTVYGKEPEEFLRGRTDAPKKMWHGLDVDEDLKDEWLEALNNVKGIEIRSSDAGKSKERIAFVVLRFADEENDDKAKALVEKLKQADDIYGATDIGMAGRPRICVAGKIWKGQDGWEKWWEDLAEKIGKAIEEVLQEGFAAEIFTPQDYEPDKLKELSDKGLLRKRKELIRIFEQRGAQPGDELVINAYQFVRNEITDRRLDVEEAHTLDVLTASLSTVREGALDKFLLKQGEKIHQLGQIIWKPKYVSVTGSAAFVTDRLPNDLDTVFRDDEVDPALLLKVDRIFEKYFTSPSHPITSPFGPNWRHLPMWDLALVPTKELKFIDINEPGFIKNFYEALSLPAAVPRAGSKEIRKQAADSIKEDKIELGRFFLGQKPTRPAFPEERMTIDSLLRYFKPEDFPVRVEKKYDGARHQAHVDGQKVQIFSDDGEDNTGRLPQTVAALKKLNLKKAVYDIEIEAWEGKKHLPREVAAGYLHSHRKPDDSHLVSNIFGLLYDGEDLHKKTEDERRAALEKIKFPQSTINEPDLKYRLNLVPSKIAKNITELRKITEDLRWRPASEGVVVKKCAGRYYLDRNSRDNWFKLHNTAVLAGIVAEVIETKVKGVYNYRYAIDQEEHDVKPGDLVEVKDREWLEVGKTFSTEKKVSRGDIIQIEFETLNFISDARTRTVKVTAWVPRFMKVLPERSTPSVLSDVVERAKKNHILRRKVITEEGKTLYESEDNLEVEYFDLDEYKQFLRERYGIDNKETGRILESQAFLETLIPDEITEAELQEIGRKDKGFAAALRKATVKAKKRPRFWAVIVNHFRKRSQHKDFRDKMNAYLEGDTIADLPEGAITEDIETIKDGRYWQEKVKFKFRPDMDPATHCVVIPKAKEPMVWLEFDDVGMGKYAAVPPGGVGACLDSESMIYTNRGMLRIKDVRVNDKVIGGSGRLRRVEEIITTENETRKCYLVHWNRYAKLIATEDHPFMVGEMWYQGKHVSKKLKNIGWKTTEELYKMRRHKKEKTKFVIPRTKDGDRGQTFNEGLVVGFILGDGHLVKNSASRVRLYFNAGKEGRLARFYQHLLRQMGIESELMRIREGKFGFCLTIRFRSEKLREIILELKKSPERIFAYSKEFAEGVYQGLLDSDGYRNEITQSDNEVKALLPFVMYHADRQYCERRDDRTGCYSLIGRRSIISDDGKWILQSIQIKEVETPGKTYNLTVEKDESYLTPLAISHNTRFGWGVFIREDAGMAYPTCKKPYFKEYFLNMKKYKGRMVIRLIPVGKEWKKPPKGKLQWQTWFNLKDQTPYILSRRARLKKDYVPDGVRTTASGLPPDWEKKIPIAMRWWIGKLSRAEKLARMDKAYNYLIEKSELKGKPLKETPEPKIANFIIRRRWWKGPKIVRDIPKQHWDLVIDSGKAYLDEWDLEKDPLIEENLEFGIAAFRKKCAIRTPKGESFRKWMEFEGSIPPKHPEWGNPNKRIPAYIKILDKDKVNWIEDTNLFSSFEFKGKILKGNVVLLREGPDTPIWVMRKGALPGEKREEVLEMVA